MFFLSTYPIGVGRRPIWFQTCVISLLINSIYRPTIITPDGGFNHRTGTTANYRPRHYYGIYGSLLTSHKVTRAIMFDGYLISVERRKCSRRPPFLVYIFPPCRLLLSHAEASTARKQHAAILNRSHQGRIKRLA